MSKDSLHAAVQKACLPGVWSKGVAYVRENCVLLDAQEGEEFKYRVKIRERPVHPKVTLWADEDEWYCDCGDRNDPCAHVAGAAITLKNAPAGTVATPRGSRLVYRFMRAAGELRVERWIVMAGAGGEQEQQLRESLVSYVGGWQSGRTQGLAIEGTRDDFAADRILSGTPANLSGVLEALENCGHLELDGKPVRASARAIETSCRVVDDGPGFRIQAADTAAADLEPLGRGVALSGGVLRPWRQPSFTPEQRECLSPAGKRYSPADTPRLVTEVIPALQSKAQVHIETTRLPEVVRVPPRAVIRTENRDGRLDIVASIVYDETPMRVALRDPAQEKALIRKLQEELHIYPGQLATFHGLEAVEFARRLKASDFGRADAKNLEAFTPSGQLQATLQGSELGLNATFTAPNGARADAASVFKAWERGEALVPLLGGGWATLPSDWLEKYGEQAQRLLLAREHNAGKLAPVLLPEVAELCAETGQSCTEGLKRLRDILTGAVEAPESPLPADLRADLRDYQRRGVKWLTFLRDAGMGALLADDMGLGKTLQTLCAIRGKTLIVAPTSVLRSWQDHLEAHRPGLTICRYTGAARELSRTADVTLTTYGILRLDEDTLATPEWDTIVLDEAQAIRNPESQVARAAHQLRGRFRVALSGTPVENRLTDLWSQFRFVNPGLLGERAEFERDLATPIGRGDMSASQRLRTRIKPFILRRLKRDVAGELPPRTEIVLHCELSEAERSLYRALLAAGRKDVLDRMEEGSGVFAALEALLRLRQACCHPLLVPGSDPVASSKLDLLLETLESSLALGHRALVFSQWTSLLDLIEPGLQARGISFSRLDGSTRDRDAVVSAFQREDGPSVFLISLKAGGVGLTLTAADHVFILDPWWNPAAEDQAADRAHRIGQKNPVLIHRLVAKDTVEDRILLLQNEKRRIAASVLDTPGIGQESITREELLRLLAED